MDFDFDCAAASPGGQWVGESASRRRQRRLSSPSLRAYLTPAFDAVAAGQGAVPGSPVSSYSSGGLELGFDASLLRYRRSCFSASADIDSRRLVYSPPPQARPVYPMPDHEALLVEAYLHGQKRQASGMTGAPGFPNLKHQFSNPTRPPPPVDFRSPEGTIMLPNRAKLSSTPEPGATAPSAQRASAQPQPTEEEDDLIAEVLYGHSGRRRLPIFKDICPE
uniref:Uncharacterized protein n=2 Tax=Avena sativa TaxID=4498 RepID=A0ACD5WS91_AVESA